MLTDGDDLAARVRGATGGVEPILGIDCVGGAATHRIAQCLAAGSTVVCYGAMSGQRCEMDFYLMFARDIRLVGMSFRRQLQRRSSAEVDDHLSGPGRAHGGRAPRGEDRGDLPAHAVA